MSRQLFWFLIGAGAFLAINCIFYDVPNSKGT
jgi:hypothetical protein